MGKYARLLRPRHGAKNLLVLLPWLLSGNADFGGFLRGLLAAASFWAAASGVYAMNDLLDAPRDRLHPVKKSRPVASGEIRPRKAAAVAAGLWALSVGAGLAAFPWEGTLSVALYIALNLAYSRGLKDVPVIDAAILASGFLIRVAYGAIAVGASVDPWILLCVAGASFHLVLDKRRNELLKAGGDTGETRKVLAAYDEGFLSRSIGLCRALAVGGYAAWAVLSGAGGRLAAWLPATVPLLLMVSLLYDLAISRAREDRDMVSLVLGNVPLVGAATLLLAAVGVILYW